jgi:hypothetical protein
MLITFVIYLYISSIENINEGGIVDNKGISIVLEKNEPLICSFPNLCELSFVNSVAFPMNM